MMLELSKDLAQCEQYFKLFEDESYNGVKKGQNNVHLYTRNLGKHYKECFSVIDKKYGFSKTGDFEQTVREILQSSNRDPLVNTALNTIRGSKDAIEPETQLNVQELLTKTWMLAKKLEKNYPDSQFLIINSLKSNSQEGGGCLAGISGRLIQPYALFVARSLERAMLEQKEENDDFQPALVSPTPPLSPVIPSKSAQEEEDLQLAITLSASEAITAQPPLAPKPSIKELQVKQQEEDDLQYAIALSASFASSDMPTVVTPVTTPRRPVPPVVIPRPTEAPRPALLQRLGASRSTPSTASGVPSLPGTLLERHAKHQAARVNAKAFVRNVQNKPKP